MYWVRNSKIAPAVKALVKSIFTFEWTKRPTIDMIGQNEWFTDGEPQTPTPPTPVITDLNNNNVVISSTTTSHVTPPTNGSNGSGSILDYNLRSRLRGSKRACCATTATSVTAPTEDKQHRQIKAN